MRQWRGCFLGAESFSLLYDAPPPLFAIVEVALWSCAAAAWSGFDRLLRIYSISEKGVKQQRRRFIEWLMEQLEISSQELEETM